MPRATDYIAWSSGNIKHLLAINTQIAATQPDGEMRMNEPDWRVAGKKKKDGTVFHTVKGAEGRPHREEAMLIQVLGKRNSVACHKCSQGHGAFKSCVSVAAILRGACGCCIWDSTTLDCSLNSVQKSVEKENKVKARTALNKETKRKLAGKVSSKRRRAAVSDDEDGTPVKKTGKTAPKAATVVVSDDGDDGGTQD